MEKKYSWRRLVLLLTGTFFFNTSAMAELACMKNIRSEEDINICQYAEAKRLELELDDLEQNIRHRFSGPQTGRFDEAQNRWLQMTEKDCEIEADFYEGAPIYQAIYSECQQRHYRERLQTLKKYLCPEYSLGNGCEPTVVVPDESAPAGTRAKVADPAQKIKNSRRFR